ncbi:MAG: dienelactone hydrolase, partial [Sphingomonadales bacterium 32-68-7]
MCDEQQLARMGRAKVNRRDFGKLGAAAAVATACAPAAAQGQVRLSENQASFAAPNGRMDAYFVHPASGKRPAVIVWPDVAGLRDAFMAMGRRLAREGFAVLVLNPYYADGEAPQFDDFDDYRENGGAEKVGPWRAKLTAPTVMEIAKAAVGFLDKQDAVDTARGIGTEGYCMGGP